MRKLLYVPIVHDETDLGSAGPSLTHGSLAQAGESRWALHQETVRGFWEEVQRCLWRIDPEMIRVYQDGLAAGGALGRRVVEEAARRGSRNYRLVLALLDRGAHLRATEDAVLLLQEHANLRRAWRQSPSAQERFDLLERRDLEIARRVNSTLQEGEVGVLLIGAGHSVRPHLADDILVHEGKDLHRVRRYVQEVLLGGDSGEFAALAAYVAAPVEDCFAEG